MPDQNSRISICALVPYPPDTTPSQRYRIEQWLPGLRAQGIAVDLFPFADQQMMRYLHKPGHGAAKAVAGMKRFARRFWDLAVLPRYDAVIIHRAAAIGGPAIVERLITLRRRPVIFDFDDAIFLLHTSEANKRFGWMKFPGKTAAICRLSAHVVTGNSYLAEYAGRYNPRVSIIPSSVDTALYKPEKRASNPRVVLGWMGSSTSQSHLEMFAPVLREALAGRAVELRVVSDRKPLLPGLDFTWRRWSAETEVKELAQFDIGIMPMPDDRWARGKCAMKALLYMSMGVATICSAVGANRELIRHGENGLLASTGEEWVGALKSLFDDPSLRDELGKAGHRTLEEHYSTERCAGLFASVIRQTVEQSQASISHLPAAEIE